MRVLSLLRIVFWVFSLLSCSLPAAAQPAKTPRVIHVLVALCDNIHQGIVPVPAVLGNGDDPDRNLYWGAAYGVRTFLQKSTDWQRLARVANPAPDILERVVFKKKLSAVWIVADAYRGAAIRKTTTDLFDFAAGLRGNRIAVDADRQTIILGIGGNADLLVYVGHDGLMDFTLPSYPKRANAGNRDIVVLACASKPYFSAGIAESGARPLVLTTNLMAPEAYTLKAIADAWAAGTGAAGILDAAAAAYAKYQKISPAAARRLFSN